MSMRIKTGLEEELCVKEATSQYKGKDRTGLVNLGIFFTLFICKIFKLTFRGRLTVQMAKNSIACHRANCVFGRAVQSLNTTGVTYHCGAI